MKLYRVALTADETEALVDVVRDYFRRIDYHEIILNREQADALESALRKLGKASSAPVLTVIPKGSPN